MAVDLSEPEGCDADGGSWLGDGWLGETGDSLTGDSEIGDSELTGDSLTGDGDPDGDRLDSLSLGDRLDSLSLGDWLSQQTFVPKASTSNRSVSRQRRANAGWLIATGRPFPARAMALETIRDVEVRAALDGELLLLGQAAPLLLQALSQAIASAPECGKFIELRLLAIAKRAGRRVAFANAYPEEVLETAGPGARSRGPLRAGPPLAALGAGGVLAVTGSAGDVAAALDAFIATRPPPGELVATAAARPLVTPPAPLRQQLVVAAAVAYAVLAVTVTRLFGAPGLLSALLLAGLLSAAAWLYARPTEPQIVGTRTVAVVGGELALATRLEEHYTLPATTVAVRGPARPLDTRAYRVDESGLQVDLTGWRSVVIVRAPELVDAPFVLEADGLRNLSRLPLHDVLVVGLGPQADIAPGALARPVPGEDGPAHESYAALLPFLPAGSVVALSGCEAGCTVWLAPALLDASVEEL